MRTNYRVVGLWVVLVVLFVAFYQIFSGPQEHVRSVTWAAVQEAADEGRISGITVRLENGRGVGSGRFSDGERFATDSRSVSEFAALEAQGVNVSYDNKPEGSLWTTVFVQWLPIVFLFLFFTFFMRQLRGKTTDPLNWTPSSEKVTQPVQLTGLAEVRARLKNAMDAARNSPSGPRRILITGAPGTGKTKLLKAVAFDAGVPLLAQSGSQFIEVFVGVGAARLRKLFKTAGESAPCIVAIDDFDAFATKRQLPDNKGGVVDERTSTMLELANILDGLSALPPKTLFIATTSRADLLDEAITRPGRFDLRINLQPGGEAQIEDLKIPRT
jgi:cell division protease FtsH